AAVKRPSVPRCHGASVNHTSAANVFPDTVFVNVRCTVVDEIVFTTEKPFDASSLYQSVKLPVRSANPNSRSYADLSRPVSSSTARGVAKLHWVTSLTRVQTAPAASSTDHAVHAKPVSLLMGLSPFRSRPKTWP